MIILDQYYLYTDIPPDSDEIGFLRTFWDAMNDVEHRAASSTGR